MMVTPGRGVGRRQSAPSPMAAGKGLTEPASDPVPAGLSSSFSPNLCPLLAWQLGTLSRPILFQRTGFGGGDWSPLHSPPRARGQGFQHRNSQKPSLFIPHSCPSTSLYKPRTRGVQREQTCVWAQTCPETVCTLRRPVRLEKQRNNKLQN